MKCDLQEEKKHTCNFRSESRKLHKWTLCVDFGLEQMLAIRGDY